MDADKETQDWHTRFIDAITSLASRLNITPAQLLVSGFTKAASSLQRRSSRRVTDSIADERCRTAETEGKSDALENVMKDLWE